MKQYTILIVDNEPEFINIIVNTLKNEFNLHFYHAISADIGFEIAKQTTPDIILTDWHMPITSGIDFIRKLKAEKSTKDIPVIMITGRMTNASFLEEAFRVGASDFVRKPIEKIELIARIKSVIKITEYQKLEVRIKNQELAIYATFFAQNNQFLLNLLNEIKQLKLIKFTQKQLINTKITKIEKRIENQTGNDSWNKFIFYFQQLHPDFENKLVNKFPDLKPSDIKLAILLRLNLSTKEIAEITFLHASSIKTARYRLRKKLQLTKSDTLFAFLTKF